MKDLFNDPKEKFKLKRILSRGSLKGRIKNKVKKKKPKRLQTLTTRVMTQEYLNLGKGAVHMHDQPRRVAI